MNEAGPVPPRPALPWSDSFAVGIDALDADHRALVELINRVCEFWCRRDRPQALQALASLAALAGEHFQREEAVLHELRGHAALEGHISEHRSRESQLAALRLRFDAAGAAEEEHQLCGDLVDWFVRQSIGHDAAIKAFFDDRGMRFVGRIRPRKTS